MAAAERLRRLRESLDGPLTLGELASRLGREGTGLLLFLIALPFLQPIPLAGLGTPVGLLIAGIGVQLILGRAEPALPAFVARRPLAPETVARILTGGEKALAAVERFARPRGPALARDPRACGAALIGLGLILAAPIFVPFGNPPTSASVMLIGLSLAEADGLAAAFGLLGTVFTIVFHAAVIGACLAMLTGKARALDTDDAKLHDAVRVLQEGDWNARVHAVYQLETLGPAGLPGLRVAAEDADWQVRMTAAHTLGRVGEPAIDDLARVVRTEPCRAVRLTALNWLGTLGPKASDALRAGLSDESGMMRVMGRYWLGKEGQSAGGDAQSDANAAETEDLKHCESSSGPGRASWAGAAPAAAPAAARDESPVDEPVVTPDPPSLAKAAAPSAKPSPETLPGAAGLPARPPRSRAEAKEEAVERARLKELDALLVPEDRGEAQTMPAAPAGFAPRESTGTAADYLNDDGKSTLENDPVPALIKLLSDADAKVRARAADELGKRGAAAAPARAPLTAALKDKDRRVRSSAALALGNLGAEADPAVPALVAALKRGPEEVRWSAALALGRIGTPRAKRAFARYARQAAGEIVRGAPPKAD